MLRQSAKTSSASVEPSVLCGNLFEKRFPCSVQKIHKLGKLMRILTSAWGDFPDWTLVKEIVSHDVDVCFPLGTNLLRRNSAVILETSVPSSASCEYLGKSEGRSKRKRTTVFLSFHIISKIAEIIPEMLELVQHFFERFPLFRMIPISSPTNALPI